MKVQSLFSLIMMSSLATLVSCGGGGQSEAKLEISKSFATAGLDTITGGLLIHGSGPNNQTFTFAIDSSTLDKTVKLNNGPWSFYAIGWDGTSKFSGNPLCAMAKQDISTNATIDLTVRSENCTDAFKSEVALNEFKTITCGSFKTYDSANNTYQDLTVSTPDNFCSTLPMGERSELPYYKIMALDSSIGTMGPSTIQSTCKKSTTEFGYVDIIDRLPLSKFPFAIKAYRSQEDCLNNGKHQIFHFPKGIQAGNPENFDQIAFQSGTSPVQTRLILPSSISKRGTSLFQNILPQFLCGSAGSFQDCFKEPVINFHIFTQWWSDNREHLLERKTSHTETSAQFCSQQSTNGKFSIHNCKVDDGNLYGQVRREEHLYCQKNTNGQQYDIYPANGLIYSLKREWNPDLAEEFSKVIAFDANGKKVQEQTHGILYEQLAVDTSGVLYGSFGSQVYNLQTNAIFSASAPIRDIQISGSLLIVALNTGVLESFSLTSGMLLSNVYVYGSDLISIQVYGNEIYFLPWGTQFVKKVSFDPVSGVISGSPISFYAAPSAVEGFGVTSSGELLVSAIDGKFYRVDSLGNQTNVYNAPTPVKNLASLDTRFVGINLSLALDLYELSGSTANVVNNSEACEDTITIGTKTLNILSSSNMPHIENYTNLVRILGLRNIVNKEHPYYLFESLQRDHDEEAQGGGYLSDVRSDLSSTGIFSLVRTGHKTCQDLALAAKLAPIKTRAIVNHYIEGETYEIDFEITPSSAPLPFCNIAGPECIADLKIKASIGMQAVLKERLVADLKCSQAAGKYELAFFEEAGEEDKELILWNTHNMNSAAFEYYSYHKKEGDEEYREVVKAKKTAANSFWVRHVNYHDSHSIGAQVMEIEGNGTNILHKSMGSMITDIYYWNQLLFNSTFYGEEANSCFAKGNTDLSAVNSYCTFSTAGLPQTSLGIGLNVDALSHSTFLNTFSLQK